MNGKVKARAREWGLDVSKNGKDQVVVLFAYVGEDGEEHMIRWYGFFTEATTDRTLDSLRYCGWTGDDLSNLEGLDANEVELVLEEEEYEGKLNTKVKWVNGPSRFELKNPMNQAQAKSFAERMRGKVVAHKQKAGGGAAPRGTTKRRDEFADDGQDTIPF